MAFVLSGRLPLRRRHHRAVRLVGAAGALSPTSPDAGPTGLDPGHHRWFRRTGGLVVPAAVRGHDLTMMIVGVLVLDVGVQGLQVTNQSIIYRLAPGARSRIVRPTWSATRRRCDRSAVGELDLRSTGGPGLLLGGGSVRGAVVLAVGGWRRVAACRRRPRSPVGGGLSRPVAPAVDRASSPPGDTAEAERSRPSRRDAPGGPAGRVHPQRRTFQQPPAPAVSAASLERVALDRVVHRRRGRDRRRRPGGAGVRSRRRRERRAVTGQ